MKDINDLNDLNEERNTPRRRRRSELFGTDDGLGEVSQATEIVEKVSAGKCRRVGCAGSIRQPRVPTGTFFFMLSEMDRNMG